jgi:hypothetical protein
LLDVALILLCASFGAAAENQNRKSKTMHRAESQSRREGQKKVFRVHCVRKTNLKTIDSKGFWFNPA